MAAEKDFAYDAVNEQIIIRAAIASGPVRRAHVRLIADSEFLAPPHPPIWRGLRAMENAGVEHDPAVFRRAVKDEGGVVDDGYLDELERGAAVPGNLEWHVATMRWDACRARLLRGALPELLEAVRSPKATPQQVQAAALGVARAVESGGARRGIDRGEEVFREYRAEIEARQAVRNYSPMGWDVLDRGRNEHTGEDADIGCGKMTEGAAPGLTAVYAGLVGSGKSTFACAFALRQARLGRRVLYCIWEMRRIATIDVMTASMTGIELNRIVQGRLTPEETTRIVQASAWVTSRIKFMRNVFFDREEASEGRGKGGGWQQDRNQKNLDVVEGYVAEAGCNVAVYDLFDRCLVDDSPAPARRAMARMLDIHQRYGMYGALLLQINLKEVEQRDDKRPTRADIKGSAGFVEVADQIFILHRDNQFKNVPDDSIELINYKQRMGPGNWTIRLDWHGATCRVGEGREVAFDPDLADADDIGDVGSIRTGRSRAGKQRRQRMGDRDR